MLSADHETSVYTPPVEIPPKLRVPRSQAAGDLAAAVKIGYAIRNQRIRDARDLEIARQERTEWVARTVDLLETLLGSPQPVEAFNSVFPKILPEFAPVGLFIESFRDELKQRLERLAKIVQSLTDLPEKGFVAAGTTQPAAADLSATAPDAASAAPSPTTVAEAPTDDPAVADSAGAYLHDARITDLFIVVKETPEASATPSAVAVPSAAAAPPVVAASNARVSTAPAPAIPSTPASSPAATGPAHRSEASVVIVAEPNCPLAKSVGGLLVRLGLPVTDAATATFAILSVTGVDCDLFELGQWVGALGSGNVLVVYPDGLAPDTRAVPQVPVSNNDAWHLPLAKLLKKSGLPVDLNRLA